MSRSSPDPQIQCPIGLFGRVEPDVLWLNAEINRTPDALEKARLAGDLRSVLAGLLDCGAYDRGNANCRLCREVSGLRDKTAALVQRAAGLVR